MSAKERLRARQSTYVAYEVLEPLPSLSRSSSATSWAGLTKASGRRSTPCTTEKIAVFAPIPRARLAIAIAANPGLRARTRAAWRRSCASDLMTASSFLPKGVQGIDTRGAASGEPAGESGNSKEQQSRGGEGRRVG